MYSHGSKCTPNLLLRVNHDVTVAILQEEKREILQITIWIRRTAWHVQRKRLENMESRKRLISNLICLLQTNGHETRCSFMCLWSFAMWIPSEGQAVLRWSTFDANSSSKYTELARSIKSMNPPVEKHVEGKCGNTYLRFRLRMG